MATYQVKTPVPDHTGAVGGVDFVKGEATVDGDKYAAELAYFRAQGYVVEEHQAAEPEVGDDDNNASTPPPRNAGVTAWREHVLTLPGVTAEQVKGLNRDQLIELADTHAQEGPTA